LVELPILIRLDLGSIPCRSHISVLLKFSMSAEIGDANKQTQDSRVQS